MPDILLAYADCVAMLHEAALSPERWTDALKASAHLFGASGILLTDLDTRRCAPRAIHTWGHDPAVLAAYAGHYAASDPTIAIGMTGVHGTVYHLREHFSEQQMSRMEYFQDFLFAFGVADVIATPVDYAPDARLFVSLQRRSGEPRFGSASHPLLGQFSRQINIAKQTESRLRSAADDKTALASGLDAIAAAMFIVDAKAHLLHHNRAADTLLHAREGVACNGGILDLGSSAVNSRLECALRSASEPQGRAATFTLALPGAGPFQVLVTPLHPAHDLATSWQMPLVLVIISDTHQMSEAAAGRMRQMYGLTPAEARLVGEVTDGKTLAEIAEQRAVSVSTLRSQLVATFGKTGVRRQVDLVRLVTALTQVADGRE